MDTLAVQIMLVVYCILAVSAVFLLWNNAAAPDALKSTGIAMASILPLLVSVLPYLNKEKLETRFTYILLYDSVQKVVTGGQIPNAYYDSYTHMFTNSSAVRSNFKLDKWTDLMGPAGLDIIEKGVVEAMLIRFQNQWDLVTETGGAPTFESLRFTSAGSLETVRLSLEQLQQIFEYNPLISTRGVMAPVGLALPPVSKLAVRQSPNSRRIVITNPYATLTILIESASGGVAQKGILGVQEPDPQNMDRYFLAEYRVSVAMALNRLKNYSPQMELYRRWYANVSEALSQFDWKRVDERIERSLTRAAFSRTSEPRQSEERPKIARSFGGAS